MTAGNLELYLFGSGMSKTSESVFDHPSTWPPSCNPHTKKTFRNVYIKCFPNFHKTNIYFLLLLLLS